MAETVVAVIPTSTIKNGKPGLITTPGKSSVVTIVGTELKQNDLVTITGSLGGGKAITWSGKLDAPVTLPNAFTATVTLTPTVTGSDTGETDNVTVTVGSSAEATIPVNQGDAPT